MQRRTVVTNLFAAGAAAWLASRPVFASDPVEAIDNWTSKQVREGFTRFARTHRMPSDLGRWLADPRIQCIEPYRVFDNVWYVGLRWVASYLIDTKDGWVLIDTTHEPFVDHLLESIAKVGVKLDDIAYVLMTHGHFDHVGGYYRLKPMMPRTRFAMSERGWKEAFENARTSTNSPVPWKMLQEKDLVLCDGETIRLGDNTFTALETAGHTWGTVSYLYDVVCGDRRHRAVTVGGLGLNAISGPEQLEAYIESMRRLADPRLGIEVDMTAHPFSNGLTERIGEIVALRPGDKHPLVDAEGYRRRLDGLTENARKTLAAMKSKS